MSRASARLKFIEPQTDEKVPGVLPDRKALERRPDGRHMLVPGLKVECLLRQLGYRRVRV
jgi:hypothetical protein